MANWLKERLVTNWQSTLTAVGIGLLPALEELSKHFANSNVKFAGYSGLAAIVIAKLLGKDTGSQKSDENTK